MVYPDGMAHVEVSKERPYHHMYLVVEGSLMVSRKVGMIGRVNRSLSCLLLALLGSRRTPRFNAVSIVSSDAVGH